MVSSDKVEHAGGDGIGVGIAVEEGSCLCRGDASRRMDEDGRLDLSSSTPDLLQIRCRNEPRGFIGKFHVALAEQGRPEADEA